MAMRAVRVQVEVPEGTSAQNRDVAERKAHEAAVLALWDGDEISTRDAAAELGLTYHDFMDLLAARGIAVARNTANGDTLARARRKLSEGQP